MRKTLHNSTPLFSTCLKLVLSLKPLLSQNLLCLSYDTPLNLHVTHKMPVWCAFHWNTSESLVCLGNKECHRLYLNVQIHYKSSSPWKYLTPWINLVKREWSLFFHDQDCSRVHGCFFLCWFLALFSTHVGTTQSCQKAFAPWEVCQQTG